MKKKRLLIIDANSLIHRAFHALPPLSTSKGEMVNAVYGFLLAFFKAINEFHPEYIAAAFDVGAPTQREKKFKAYKAKREKAPDELYSQIPKVKEVLGAFHVPVFEKEGFEADDLIGTVAKLVAKRQVVPGVETIILSGDMDLLQLVDKNTKVYTMRKGIQDSVLFDEKKVNERFGVGPSLVADWKGLRGDPSDNIPGVAGVGEKTATQLLSSFGSLESLYAELESNKELKGVSPRLRETLLKEKDIALLSKELATIDTAVSVGFRLPDLAWKGFNKKEAEDVLKSFEFRTLASRIPDFSGKEEEPKEEKDHTAEKIEHLFKEGVLSEKIYELELALSPVLRTMEDTGIQIDEKFFAKLGAELKKNLKRLELSIIKKAGATFNVGSPKQLSEVLFEKLNLSFKGLHKTPGGVVSTASPELEKIRDVHPIIPEILGYREFAKLQNTYVLPLPKLADKEGRVHTHFDQLGAATGRLSSFAPNLQNVPLQGEWGEKIRHGFVAKKGFSLLSCDYSQVELRIASHIAGEEKMQNIFRQGRDIHRETASVVFGVSDKEVTPQMRFRAKALNFGILYGMGARGFAQSAGVSFEEAQDFIENYFLQFPHIAQYMEDTVSFVREYGYAETLFGRKRYLPDINSTTPHIKAAAERVAINHPIQGCLPWETKILTSGGYIPIGELYGIKKQRPPFVWDGVEWRPYKVLNRGKAQLAEIIFSNGQVFRCDTRHQVLTVQKDGYTWKHFSELNPKTRVCFSLPSVHEFPQRSDTFSYISKAHNGRALALTPTSALWYWLGYYIGDGHLYKQWDRGWQYGLEYFFGDHETKKRKQCVEFFASFGLRPRERSSIHRPHKKISRRHSVIISSKGLGILFEKFGFPANVTAQTKRLSPRVFTETYENRSAFIKGIMESDGGMGHKKEIVPNIHLCQRELLQDIQLLLRTLGVASKIYGPYTFQEKVSFRLDIHRNMLAKILGDSDISVYQRSLKNLTPSFLIQELVLQTARNDVRPATRSEAVLLSRWKHGGSSSLLYLQDWLERHMLSLSQPLYDYNEIVEVKKLPEVETTYTLTVPGSHRFDSEGVISKNTAADITKMAMVKIAKTPSLQQENCRMLLQIHDELLFEVADDIVEKRAKEIEVLMKNIVSLKVPLEVKTASGKDWGTLKVIP